MESNESATHPQRSPCSRVVLYSTFVSARLRHPRNFRFIKIHIAISTFVHGYVTCPRSSQQTSRIYTQATWIPFGLAFLDALRTSNGRECTACSRARSCLATEIFYATGARSFPEQSVVPSSRVVVAVSRRISIA